MIEEIFKTVLTLSCIGTALFGILILIKPITSKFFSSRWHYYMWLAVLITMIMPIRFSLPPVKSISIPKSEPVAVSETTGANMDFQLSQKYETEDVSKIQNENVDTQGFNTLKRVVYNKISVISAVWFFTALCILLFKILIYVIFLRKIRKSSDIVFCPEIFEFTNRNVIVRVSENISSPIMLGIFKPTLLLPKKKMTQRQLYNVLRHEMTHFKRNDILYKWFLNIIKCIHWFNPAIYFISEQIGIDCEISCDMAVTDKMNADETMSYVGTILALLSNKNTKNIPLTTGMAESKKILKRRFIMIKKKKRISRLTSVISIIIAVIIISTTVFASGIINGKYSNTYSNDILELNTDKPEGRHFNFLVLGLDEQNSADSIMVLSFDGEIVAGISIPRNTAFGDIENPKRLSSILREENGDQKVIDAVRNKFSIPITYYAKINLSAVKDIIDSVGNIEFDVPMDMVYDDPYKNLHINLKQGRQSLNGEQVCGLLQFRKSNGFGGYKEGDISRISTTQGFIKEFVKQKVNKENLNKAADIYKIVSDNVSTNYSLTKLAKDKNLFESIKNKGIEFYTLPGELVTLDNHLLFYEIDFSEAKGILYKLGYKENYLSSENNIE